MRYDGIILKKGSNYIVAYYPEIGELITYVINKNKIIAYVEKWRMKVIL
jgi:hypothetical protein